MLKKKILSRKFLALLIGVPFALFFFGRFYFFLTDGFVEKNIYKAPMECPFFAPLPDAKAQEKIEAVLSAPFYYLGKGCQSYVFESQDKKYVLKFFKYQRFFITPWLNAVKNIPFFEKIANKRQKEKEKKLCRLWEGAFTAISDLQKETKVLFVQLKPRIHWKFPLILYDKLGLQHSIHLNEVSFILQEKGETLEHVLKYADPKRKEAVLKGLRHLIEEEEKKGYTDYDPALLQNTAVIGEEPFHADVGQLRKRQEPYSQEKIEERLSSIFTAQLLGSVSVDTLQ